MEIIEKGTRIFTAGKLVEFQQFMLGSLITFHLRNCLKRKEREKKKNLQSIPIPNFPHKTCHFALPSTTPTIITPCLLLIASTAEAQRGALAQSQAFIRGSICCMALVHTQKKLPAKAERGRVTGFL